MADQPHDRARRTVFVSRSRADADAGALVRLLRDGYDVVEATSVASGLPAALAVPEAMRAADVVLVLLPAPEDPAHANVVYEAGVAVGAGLPVVVSDLAGPPPGILATLTYARGDDIGQLRRALDKASRPRPRRGSSAGGAGLVAHRPALRDDEAARFRDAAASASGELRLAEVLAAVFEAAGADVSQSDRPADLAQADLSIWQDGLQAAFGLPLPVEILSRTGRLRPVRKRLLRTMRLAGAQSLLVVLAGNRPTNEFWTDGTAKILGCDAGTLIGALSRAPLDEALVGLLDQAEPTA